MLGQDDPVPHPVLPPIFFSSDFGNSHDPTELGLGGTCLPRGYATVATTFVKFSVHQSLNFSLIEIGKLASSNGACERSVSGEISAHRSYLFLQPRSMLRSRSLDCRPAPRSSSRSAHVLCPLNDYRYANSDRRR